MKIPLAFWFALSPFAGPAVAQPLAPLAQVHDDRQLAAILAAITQDLSIKVDDPRARIAAQALMTEGVHRLQIQAYDQALANFLEAYDRCPSPKILLPIASTLEDMGRLADAANTYQRYLDDPATSPERAGEIKDRLIELDGQLAILTVRVAPRGSEVSIDAGPFVPVGISLRTRIRPGTHSLRIRNGAATDAIDLHGFAGEAKDLSLEVAGAAPAPPTARPPDQVEGWLVTGRAYGTVDGDSRGRRVHADLTGADVKPYVPGDELDDDAPPDLAAAIAPLTSGAIGLVRIDGNHGRGFAGGIGLAYAASDRFEVEVAGLKSDLYGAYVGARYLLLAGGLRPYLAAGLPMFFFTDDADRSQVSLGGRLAAGLEIELNGHLSVHGDLGVEHFFNVHDVVYKMHALEATTFAPTIGVIGRL